MRRAIEYDHAPLGNQIDRDPEENQIHQGKVPQGGGRTHEAAQLQRLHDGHRDEQEKQRDAETKERRKTRTLPLEPEFLRTLFDDLKTETIADRFKLAGIADHRSYGTRGKER